MTRDEVVREMAKLLCCPEGCAAERANFDGVRCSAPTYTVDEMLAEAEKHGWYLLNIENDWAFMAVVTQLPFKRRQAFYRAVKEMVSDAGDGE